MARYQNVIRKKLTKFAKKILADLFSIFMHIQCKPFVVFIVRYLWFKFQNSVNKT